MNQIGALAATMALAIPFTQDCEIDQEALEAASCCESSLEPKCGDSEVTACVCDLDSYCCSTAWDSKCVQKAADHCDAGCPGAG